MFYKRGSSPQQWSNSKETTTIVRVNDSETKLALAGGGYCFLVLFLVLTVRKCLMKKVSLQYILSSVWLT